ncbi:PREDICTED: serine hydrolase-like protein 2 [Elephantulus edwardii]|uniref:serine hydrolase-like protein 2 n=1 Tax=Elephantulus edwardii TaxID=28737 RepID=UPI0003F0B0EB|nr:PREDICTED: serine hydrolase-like protein 2 [Elephantulus edwardii]
MDSCPTLALLERDATAPMARNVAIPPYNTLNHLWSCTVFTIIAMFGPILAASVVQGGPRGARPGSGVRSAEGGAGRWWPPEPDDWGLRCPSLPLATPRCPSLPLASRCLSLPLCSRLEGVLERGTLEREGAGRSRRSAVPGEARGRPRVLLRSLAVAEKGKGLFSELKVAVPWGHIAAKAWGSLKGPPVLCLHGWLDNANSFDRLIPLLPQDFYYVAMDWVGHGLSSHRSPGLPYYGQDFVADIRRVAAALKWNRFSLMGHSFGGTMGGMFSCVFPEMVEKLVLIDSLPLVLDCHEKENMLNYKRKVIEHVLRLEVSGKPPKVLSPEEMLQGLLRNNTHMSEECGRLLLQRGSTPVGTGVMLNRDRRLTLPELCLDFISKDLFLHYIQKLQARVLLLKACQGYRNPRRTDSSHEALIFVLSTLQSVLREQYQFVEVPGNHYVHMIEPHQVAKLISTFLQSEGASVSA